MKKSSFPEKPNHQTSYRIGCGYEVKNGQRKPAQFILGTDRQTAKRKFDALQNWWEFNIQGEPDAKVWTQELKDAAMASVSPVQIIQQLAPIQQTQSQVRPTIFPPPSNPPQVATGQLTLHQGFRLYLDSLKAKWQGGEIGQRHYEDEKHRLSRVMTVAADMPLNDLDTEDKLRRHLRYHWTSLPLQARRGPAGGGKPQLKPISPVTAATYIQTAGAALRWLDMNNHWKTAPKHWEHVFVLNKADQKALIKDPAALKQFKKPKLTFTADEVAVLYRCCDNQFQRLLVLSAAFLSWTQKELSTLRKDQFDTRNGELFIAKPRSKTGIDGDWWVCPELAKLFLQSAADTKGDLVCLTETGLPLVHHSQSGVAVDATAQQWVGVRNRAIKKGVRKIEYRGLRRFAGQVMKNLADHELCKVFMAHTLGDNGSDVNETHYTGRGVNVGVGETQFERVHKVQRKMYEELRPMLFGTVTPKLEAQIAT